MKNQYFGDLRDLFKFDLIRYIMKGASTLQSCTFIPMLTKNDKRGDGNKRNFDRAEQEGRPGTKNNELMEFLEKYKEIDRDKRDFTEIKNYFNLEHIEMNIYEGHDGYFDHKKRDEYFSNLPEKFPHKSLVFVDPDIGLKIKNSTEKHLLYREVKGLYDRMDKDSILMIFQHFPREDHKEYLRRRANALKELTGDLPICISDNEIIFFLLTKSDELRSQLERIISEYERDYPDYTAQLCP